MFDSSNHVENNFKSKKEPTKERNQTKVARL